MPLLSLSTLLRPARRTSKRVLFARDADTANFNAQAKNAQNILRRWRSPHVRAAVFSFREPDPGVAANPNVDIVSIRPDRFWTARVFAAYMGGFDAVFCPGLHHYADWAALKLRALAGRPLPIVSTMEGLLGIEGDTAIDRKFTEIAGHPAYSQKIPRSHWRRADDLYAMADHIIAISPYLVRQASALYGEKVSMLPLGVDVASFRRPQRERRARPRVVCAAHVRPHKQPDVLLALAAQFPQADFAWFGEGELRGPLMEKAAREGIANVAFSGMLPAETLAREFAKSDIMVLPSRNEGVPKVTQEAAAAGLAQIVFGFYEAPSVVDGVNGFVVWNNDEMVARLAALLADPDLVERMGRAGAAMAEDWSWDVVAPLWQDRIVLAVDRSVQALPRQVSG